MLPILVDKSSHAQSTQNSKFAKSLQMSYKVDFLHADKYQSFQQVDTIFFVWFTHKFEISL